MHVQTVTTKDQLQQACLVINLEERNDQDKVINCRWMQLLEPVSTQLFMKHPQDTQDFTRFL